MSEDNPTENSVIIPQQASSNLSFLSEVDSFSRRRLLAEHHAFCVAMKDQQQCQDYLVEERAQDVGTTTTTLAKPSRTWFVPQVKLQEPRIQRTSIYENFLRHFQQFHNEQDALALVSLILYPCFSPDIVRETNFWITLAMSEDNKALKKTMIAAKRSSIGLEGMCEHYTEFFQSFPDAILVYGKPTVKPLTTVHVNGLEKLVTKVVAPFTYFMTVVLPGSFLTIPMNIERSASVDTDSKDFSGDLTDIEDVTCSSSSNESVRSDIEEDALSNSSHGSECCNERLPSKPAAKVYTASPYPSSLPPIPPSDLATSNMFAIRLEFTGYSTLYFDDSPESGGHGQIVKSIDHIFMKNCSQPNITLTDLLKYAGYEVSSS